MFFASILFDHCSFSGHSTQQSHFILKKKKKQVTHTSHLFTERRPGLKRGLQNSIPYEKFQIMFYSQVEAEKAGQNYRYFRAVAVIDSIGKGLFCPLFRYRRVGRRARRTKSKGPKGLQLEVGAQRAPKTSIGNKSHVVWPLGFDISGG